MQELSEFLKDQIGILIKKSAYLDSLLKLSEPMEQVASF